MAGDKPIADQDPEIGLLVEIGSGNVFADLGFANPDEEAVKARIVRKIQKVIDERGLTQKQAGEIIGLPQSKVSTLLRGKWDSDYTVDRLTGYLNKLGVSVTYSFKDQPDWRDGRLVVSTEPRGPPPSPQPYIACSGPSAARTAAGDMLSAK